MTVRLRLVMAWLALAAPSLAEMAAAQTASVPDTAMFGVHVINTPAAWREIDAAREAAGHDAHAASAAAFIRGLNHDARLVGEVCDELAFQKLWLEQHDRAIFYFRRYLARHPGEVNRDARKGLALAYSWSGRQGLAIDMYRRLVEEDPGDLDARLGFGRSLIWGNHLHEGFHVLRGLEIEHPDDDHGAGDFLLTTLDSYEPHVDIRWDGIRDSDDLTIHRYTVRGRANVGEALPEVGAGVAFIAQSEEPDVTAPRFQAGLVAPLAHTVTLHAYGWVDHLTSDGALPTTGESLDWTRLGGDGWLTWQPLARLRLDLGASSQVVETYVAFGEHLHYEPLSLSADWRFARQWTLSGAGQYASYSDDNTRRRGSLQLWWKHTGAWDLAVGPGIYVMDYTHPYPGGYWAPEGVRNATMAAKIAHHWARLAIAVDGSYGVEKETDADAIAVGGIHGHVGWRFVPGWLLGLDAAHSRSRFTSDSGYHRTTGTVAIRALF